MRRFAKIIGTTLPLLAANMALAEDVVIRIEAKRGEAAAREAAAGWSRSLENVVTFPLPDGWFGVALGPMPRESAEAQLEAMKAQNKVPADSFIAASANRTLTPIVPSAAAVPDEAPAADAGSPSTVQLPDATATTAPAPQEAQAQPAPSEPEFYIRVQTVGSEAEGQAALAKWRETLPEAGLWQLGNNRLTVALGPMNEAKARAWLAAFRAAGDVPRDAFVHEAEKMGTVKDAGSVPELGDPPAEGTPEVAMPPLEDIQRALRWAGHYEGAIDGKDGPMTQTAIAQEVVRLRGSPDRATAMRDLIQRREAWRAEIGLTELRDAHTGLSLPAPLDRVEFDRTERALSIYRPKNDSGAALILFSQPGGQQEMLDLTGLVTALGWVPAPERRITRGAATLIGRNDTHIGQAEARVIDGRAEGFVLIWPLADEDNQVRVAAEMADAIARFAPAANDAPATGAGTGDPLSSMNAKNGEAEAPEPTQAPVGPETSP